MLLKHAMRSNVRRDTLVYVVIGGMLLAWAVWGVALYMKS
jgi:hypothetical protein